MKRLFIIMVLLSLALPMSAAAFTAQEMGYSMPSTAPLYAEGPYEYRDCWEMAVVFKSTPEVRRELVPEPLEPNADNIMWAWFGTLHAAGFGPYNEAIIGVPARFKDISGSYVPYIYLDSDAPIAAGREIWGWPKKAARFVVVQTGEVVRYTVERGGVEIIKASVLLEDTMKPEDVPPRQPIFNLKIIPSVKQGAPPDVQQLTVTTGQNYRVKRAYRGKATVEFGTSPADPLHRIKVDQVLGGNYRLSDWDLTYGDVLYDYLAD